MKNQEEKTMFVFSQLSLHEQAQVIFDQIDWDTHIEDRISEKELIGFFAESLLKVSGAKFKDKHVLFVRYWLQADNDKERTMRALSRKMGYSSQTSAWRIANVFMPKKMGLTPEDLDSLYGKFKSLWEAFKPQPQQQPPQERLEPKPEQRSVRNLLRLAQRLGRERSSSAGRAAAAVGAADAYSQEA